MSLRRRFYSQQMPSASSELLTQTRTGIRYVLIHKALMPESKVSQKGAISLQIKYAIRHLAGSPVKWFGLAPYNPLIEIQPLFLATERPPRLKRV